MKNRKRSDWSASVPLADRQQPKRLRSSQLLITALVTVHLATSVWHGGLHTELGINLSTAQNLFVFVVILILPIVGTVLVWTRLRRTGLWTVFFSMLGALLFGIFYHFIFPSPDNVRWLPQGNAASHQFTLSAGVIALVELASALLAIVGLKRNVSN